MKDRLHIKNRIKFDFTNGNAHFLTLYKTFLDQVADRKNIHLVVILSIALIHIHIYKIKLILCIECILKLLLNFKILMA